MAKASRSKKSQPAFDPHELEDLIFTPAVGRGVGSHLLADDQESARPATGDESTVVMSKSTTEPEINLSTEVDSQLPAPVNPLQQLSDLNTTTVDKTESTTVSDSNPTTVVRQEEEVEAQPADRPTVANSNLATVVKPATVGISKSATVDRSTRGTLTLWVTETGDVVPGSRTRRIRLAQDVLNSAEEAVYDTLWRSRFAEPAADSEDARIVQAGYDFLIKQTRLSKKTIQRIVDRLTDKDFIAIERPADIYRRTPTVYRVFSYRAVLERQARKGRLHVAKIGPGFVFVRPLERLLTTGDGLNLSTVATPDAPTEASAAAPTVVPSNPPTVVLAATKRIGQLPIDSPAAPSSSEVKRLRGMLERELAIIDDDAVESLLAQCRFRAGDCSLEEIAYFVRHKLQWVKGIQNPVGFVLTAVPRHFENNGHLSVRRLLRQQFLDKRRAWEETYAYWQRIAEDPAQPENDRLEARKVLASLEAAAEEP